MKIDGLVVGSEMRSPSMELLGEDKEDRVGAADEPPN